LIFWQVFEKKLIFSFCTVIFKNKTSKNRFFIDKLEPILDKLQKICYGYGYEIPRWNFVVLYRISEKNKRSVLR